MNIKLEVLLFQLQDSDTTHTREVIEELRKSEWLFDGSLKGASLCGAHLHGADMKKANLSGANFHQANLEWADFSDAKLRSAKLTLSNICNANLKGAVFDNADLYKANLREVHNLTPEQLGSAARLWGATMPEGETYDGRFNLYGDLELAHVKDIDLDDNQAMADFYGVSLEKYCQGQDIHLT
jgi:uncharacterized protein YjbI with pentapeptide repeats